MVKKSKSDEINQLKAGWQRTQADFENYRKRIEKERENWTGEAKVEVFEKLLPILDNLALAASHVPQDEKNNQWAHGIILIVKQLEATLDEIGIEKIEPAAGSQFNHSLHEAVASEKLKGRKSGSIIKVQKSGYKLQDKIIRAAKVVVAQ